MLRFCAKQSPIQRHIRSSLPKQCISYFSSSTPQTPSPQTLPNKANVIIIGGGIIGTSVAYHLSKISSIKDVILLEKDKVTSGTTWHAAGLINTFGSLSSTSTSMRQYTKKLYSQTLPEETGLDTGFKPVGFIELACDEDRLAYYRRVRAFNQLCEVDVEEISAEQVKEKCPIIETSDVLAGFYVKDDGRVNPYDACMALAKGAKMNGVEIYENVSVDGISKTREIGDGAKGNYVIPKVTGVTVENGRHHIEANVVVNCAGMWARQLGQICGVNSIPLQAAEHYYLITDTMEEVDPSWPVVEDSSKCVYIRPEGDGLMLGLFERMGAPWMVDAVPDNFSFGEIEPDWDRMGGYLQDAMERVPATLQAGAKKFFCGPESFTPDGNPIIGEAPELQNYYVAAGLNSIGILTGGGIGKIMAEWIQNKQAPSDVDVTGININRFHSNQSNVMYRAHRAGETLGETYKVHYPDHSPKTCRNVKQSVLHNRLKSKSAYFRDVSGWESPSWYAPPGIEPHIYKEHFGKQSFFPYWRDEHLACRNNVALFDMSFMSKFMVVGENAGTFLNSLSTANVNDECGKITYTQWLNEDGFLEADLTVTKMDESSFLVVATDTMHNHVLTWMKKRLTSNDHVFVSDVTGAYAQINLQGPNSRDLLQSVTSVNLGDFPFRSAAEIDIGYGRCLCTRITYVGELGYELFIPNEFAQHVYDNIVAAGNSFGLKHAGLRALGSLRLEKAYRDYGHDIDNTDTILECGLGFTCDFNKDGGFVGQEAVLMQKKASKENGGLNKRMAQVLLDNPDHMLHHGEVVWRNGERVSDVRSASYGHTLGGAVGLTMLEASVPIKKRYLDAEWAVEIGNEHVPCQVSLAPMYDPKNMRIRV